MNEAVELKMYGKLLELSLFQGMSRNDLGEIVAHSKFGFHKYADGDIIVSEGEPCDRLFMLVDGTVEARTVASDKGYSVTETLASPNLLQPERLFGLTQRYSTDYRAKDKCHLLSLSKEEVVYLMENFTIFRMNILNLISTLAQKSARSLWTPRPSGLRQRIIRFFASHCSRPAGEKVINIKMTRLAEELNDNRINISSELNRMQDEQLLKLARAKIIVPALEKLLTE